MTTAVLTGNGQLKAEDFVLRSQKTATEDGFRNVSKKWYDTTLSYEEGLEQLEKGMAQTEDIVASLSKMRMGANGLDFVVWEGGDYDLGRYFKPTPHALSQLASWAGVSTGYAERLATSEGRDHDDAEVLYLAMQNGLRRLDPNKDFLWRVRADGTLRAVLSTSYVRVDNRWLIEQMAELVPGGRLSHWRGDQDTLWGNVLIPDTIRQESDSDYGGMLSIGNSEIGERRLSSLPSIFRAICMNGCIWGQEKGKGINRVHRGNLDLAALRAQLAHNLQLQVPLLPQGIESLLASRGMGWGSTSKAPVLAEAARSSKLTKKQADLLLESWNEEQAVAPQTASSLFGLVAAFTRAGQKMDNATWVKLDQFGGKILAMNEGAWALFLRRARSLSAQEVEATFSLAA